MKKYLIAFLIFFPIFVTAANDPACAGKDQDVCDMLGVMLIAKGKLCSKMLTVTPLAPRNGGDRYQITCKVSSSSATQATYLLEFGPGNRDYEVR